MIFSNPNVFKHSPIDEITSEAVSTPTSLRLLNVTDLAELDR